MEPSTGVAGIAASCDLHSLLYVIAVRALSSPCLLTWHTAGKSGTSLVRTQAPLSGWEGPGYEASLENGSSSV